MRRRAGEGAPRTRPAPGAAAQSHASCRAPAGAVPRRSTHRRPACASARRAQVPSPPSASRRSGTVSVATARPIHASVVVPAAAPGPSCARAASVAELFGSRAPAQAVEVTEAMARLLLGAACLPTRGRPPNTQLVLNASRAALMRLVPRGHALTMSVVKQILVAAQRQVWGGASRPPAERTGRRHVGAAAAARVERYPLAPAGAARRGTRSAAVAAAHSRALNRRVLRTLLRHRQRSLPHRGAAGAAGRAGPRLDG